jgi:glycosyltransferase involved in cell wall biosynthesis
LIPVHPLRIFVNTLPYYGKGEGVRVYTRGLLEAFHASSLEMEWGVWLHPRDFALMGLGADPRFHIAPLARFVVPPPVPGLRFAWRNALEHIGTTTLARRYDVVHFLDSYGPVIARKGVPQVITVHDVIPLEAERFHRSWVRWYLGHLMATTLPRASAVAAISAYTAAQVQHLTRVDARQLRVVHNGVDPCCMPATAQEQARVLQQYQVSEPYVLCIGTIEPRKNIPRIIRAFDKFKHVAQSPHTLLIVGKPGSGMHATLAAMAEAHHRTSIRLLGYIPRADIPPLLTASTGVLYLSLNEGFGLPIIEGMACEAAVLTSDIPVLREVAGNAALYVDPTDDDQIAEALRHLCTQDALRSALRRAGRSQAQHFSWDATAAQIAQIYHDLQPPVAFRHRNAYTRGQS